MLANLSLVRTALAKISDSSDKAEADLTAAAEDTTQAKNKTAQVSSLVTCDVVAKGVTMVTAMSTGAWGAEQPQCIAVHARNNCEYTEYDGGSIADQV